MEKFAWPAAIVIIVVATELLFREPINRLIGSITRFKHKNVEVDISPAPLEPEGRASPLMVSPSEPASVSEPPSSEADGILRTG